MYLLLCVTIFCALIQPGVLFPEIAKYRPFFLIMVISLITLMLSSYNKKIPEALKSNQSVFILGLLGCEVFGYFMTESYLTGSKDVLVDWLILFFIFLMPAVVVDSLSRAKTMLWVIVFGASFIFWEGFKILKYSPELMSDGRLASYGMYEGANDFALILVFVFPIAFKLFFLDKSK